MSYCISNKLLISNKHLPIHKILINKKSIKYQIDTCLEEYFFMNIAFDYYLHLHIDTFLTVCFS